MTAILWAQHSFALVLVPLFVPLLIVIEWVTDVSGLLHNGLLMSARECSWVFPVQPLVVQGPLASGLGATFAAPGPPARWHARDSN